MSKQNNDEIVFTYLAIWSNSDLSEYVCGVLSVDLNGFPIEYRFTDKIELDEAQQIFYGKSLKSYLIKEVIGPKIIDILEKRPNYIFVDEKELLGINEIVNVPTIYIITDDEVKLQGKDKDIDLFNKIPKIKIQLDIEEPFKRLKEAIEFSLKNNI